MARSQDEKTSSTRADSRANRILVVDDDEDTAAAIAEFLRVFGYEVKIASCLKDALGLAGETDLLVSDITLPDGSGYDLMREIRSRGTMPGIALSGYGGREDTELSEAAGFDRHLVKPVNPRELLAIVEQLGVTR